jgi:PAS domain S-box-containing protein
MSRILIVDDNAQNLYLLESILKGYKFQIQSARNGAEALEAALANPPDMIVSDILMPVMDGFELCRRWKADGRLKDIPFIFYTATYTDPKDEEFALSLGADRFIVKPQKPDFLGRIVREVLEKYQNRETAPIKKPLGDEMEVLRQYNEVLFRKLEKKVSQFEAEIAERRRVEEELRTYARRLQEAQQMAHLGFWTWDIKTGRVEWSDEVYRIFGLDKTKFTPEIDSILALSPWPEDHERDKELIRRATESRKPGMYEQRFLKPDKSIGHYHSTFEGRYDEKGRLVSVVGTVLEITKRKNAEEELRKSEARYRTLYESMRDGFVRADMQGKILEYNQSYREMLGYTDEELVRMTCPDVTPERWHAFENYILETQILARGYSDVYEKEYRKKDGTVFPVELRSYLIRDDNGQPAGKWAIVRDITDRKRADEKIGLANRKLALMTEVTYQDIQNKVTGLRGYTELLKNAGNEQERTSLIMKQNGILESIHDLIRKTKDYQLMGRDKSVWIPIEDTIRMEFALLSVKHDVSLHCDLHGFEIYAEPHIERVFYNLMHNAVKHGRTITRISFSCTKTPGGAILTCEDDGAGIPAEEKPYIFERVVGGGGKFGLFFVREFLTLHGITITETGTPGKGARFEIAVPKDLCRTAGN